MAVRIARVSLLLVAAAAGLGRLSVALEGRGRARRALGVAMLHRAIDQPSESQL